jgi:hypothetical protein
VAIGEFYYPGQGGSASRTRKTGRSRSAVYAPRGDLLDVVERRQALPQLAVLPRQTELQLPLELVVVVAVIGGVEHLAGAGHRSLEAVGLGDHVVGQDAAVGPAADAETLGIGVAAGDGVVDRGHHVFVVLVPPIREDGGRERLALGRCFRIRGV